MIITIIKGFLQLKLTNSLLKEKLQNYNHFSIAYIISLSQSEANLRPCQNL